MVQAELGTDSLRRADGLAKREPPPSTDPAVRKLHELSQISGTSMFRFLGALERSSDPAIEALYGYGHRYTDRLARVQANDDHALFLRVPGADAGNGKDLVLVQANTWAAKERATNPSKGLLNEDATLVVPFGNGRLLAAVFDGASSRRPIPGLATAEFEVSGAWYVSHLASLDFIHSPEYGNLLRNPNIEAKDIMATLNGWLKGKLRKIKGVSYEDVIYIPGMAATIALIDYTRQQISIAHAADTMAVAEYDTDFSVLTDDKNFQWDEMKRRLEDELVQEQMAKGMHATRVTVKDDPRVKTHLEQTYRAKINSRPLGTGILNGQTELVTNNLIYADVIPIPTEGGLKLHLVSDGVYTVWMGRESQHDLRTGARKLLGALDNPISYPGNTLWEVASRINLDPEGLVLGRASDDSSRVSIVVKEGDNSEEARKFKTENNRLLLRDSAEFIMAHIKHEAETSRPLADFATSRIEYLGLPR